MIVFFPNYFISKWTTWMQGISWLYFQLFTKVRVCPVGQHFNSRSEASWFEPYWCTGLDIEKQPHFEVFTALIGQHQVMINIKLARLTYHQFSGTNLALGEPNRWLKMINSVPEFTFYCSYFLGYLFSFPFQQTLFQA